MGTTTKFNREIAHIDDSYSFTILLTEERHRTCLLCFLDTHNLGHYRKILSNFLVNDCFHPGNLFLRHSLIMCKVKTETILIYIRSRLFHMSAKHGFKCLLQQMCC